MTGVERVRAVDAYRAYAILTVIAGHWLAFALSVQDGRLTGRNLLEIWPPAPWLTWLFQVMPVFFLVGGYANAASWTNRRGTLTPLGWIGARLWRLLLPTAVLLVTVTAAAMLARTLGMDEGMLGLALAIAGLPLWFLAVYVAVVPLTPLLAAGQRRWGARVPLALLASAVVVDVLFVHLGVPLVGYLNFAFFWIGVYCLGIAWRGGALPGRAWVPGALAIGGFVALVLLVVLGPYPVSMLGAAGERVQNNGPPSAALVALALTQTGIVLLLRERVERWCAVPAVWRVVVPANLVAMSLYLWHMVAGVLASVVVWQVGLVAAAAPTTPVWWLWRPLWYATCATILAVLVLLVRRFERPVQALPGTPASSPRRVAAAVAGVLGACSGMVQLTVAGLGAGPAGLPLLGLAGFGLGAALLAWSTGALRAAARAAPASRPLP